MSSKSNNQGRAYEYICLHSLQDAISAIRKSQIETSAKLIVQNLLISSYFCTFIV